MARELPSLVESDILPLELQLSVIARLPLPVAAIIFSGGKSYHALVQVDASDAFAYRRDVGRMLSLLRPLGFDQGTGNPSRMSRLPGAMRGGQQQRLLYLNPDARGETPIFEGIA
jgi:RecA-family ATPase